MARLQILDLLNAVTTVAPAGVAEASTAGPAQLVVRTSYPKAQAARKAGLRPASAAHGPADAGELFAGSDEVGAVYGQGA